MSRYLVTTPGASATRWLSFALACHSDVYVTHGKFALDSVSQHGLDEEHRQGDRGSLTRGNELREFYAARTLDEIFAAYREAAPGAKAHGNVHTLTIGELLQREKNGESLEGIRIVNLVRHPIGFIESHTALVLSAEAQPDLREHYRRVFREAVGFCPEALLVETDQPVEAMAFVISCYAARQTALDLECERWPNARMEDLTTDVAALSRFCRDVTGLEYPAEELERLVQGGPINSHRAKPRRKDPAAAWHEWPTWRRDLFWLFASPQTFDLWQAAGYDVRAAAEAASFCTDAGSAGHDARAVTQVPFLPVQSSGPCLGDFSDQLGLRRERPAAVLLEENFCGFDLYEAGPQAVALATSLGEVDWRQTDMRTLAAWQREGFCIIAPGVEVIREMLLAQPPVLVDSHDGYNIVGWRGQFVAIAQWLGHVDLAELSEPERKRCAANQSLLWGHTFEEARKLIDERCLPQLDPLTQPPSLVDCRNGFNIVQWQGRFVAIAQLLGPVDLAALSEEQKKRLVADKMLLWGTSLEQLRQELDDRAPSGSVGDGFAPEAVAGMLAARPPRLVEERSGFNVVEWHGRFAAVAQSIGPVDLTVLSEEQTKQFESERRLLWGLSLDEVRRRVDNPATATTEPWMHRLHRRARSVPRRAATTGRRVYGRLFGPASAGTGTEETSTRDDDDAE
jgi:hypothetical protein